MTTENLENGFAYIFYQYLTFTIYFTINHHLYAYTSVKIYLLSLQVIVMLQSEYHLIFGHIHINNCTTLNISAQFGPLNNTGVFSFLEYEVHIVL